MPTRLISRRTIAERLEVSPRTLMRMIEAGKFIKPHSYIVGQPRWLESMVDAWILLHKGDESEKVSSKK